MSDHNTSVLKLTHEIDWVKPDRDQLVTFVDSHVTHGRQRRLGWEAEAAKRLAWVQGDQMTFWNADDGRLAERDVQDVIGEVSNHLRSPVMVNTLYRLVITRIAMLLAEPTTFSAKPATGDDEDVAAARMQGRLLRWLWRRGPRPIRQRIVVALFQTFSTGICWIKPTWDVIAGGTKRFGPEFDKGDDDDTRSRKREEFKTSTAARLGKKTDKVAFREDGSIDLPEGDVRWEFPTGFEITEPPLTKSIDEAEWLIHSFWKPFEWLKHRFGEEAVEDIQPMGPEDELFVDWSRVHAQSSGSESEGATTGDAVLDADMVLVHELWRPHRPWLPQGFKCVVVQKSLLHFGPHPYKHRELPFIPIVEIPSTRFRPPSTISMAMNLQEARNKLRSQVAAAVGMAVVPNIFSEKGSGLPEDAFTAGTSRILELKENGIQKIKVMEPPVLPSDWRVLDELYRTDMQDVGGVHDSSLGRSESAQQSGRHALALQRSDQLSNSVARQLIGDAIAQAGHQSLWLYWEFATEKRLITVTGRGMRAEVLSFTGAGLLGSKTRTPAPADFNVEVTLGVDVDQVMQTVEALTALGYLNPENEADKLEVRQLVGRGLPSDEPNRDASARDLAIEETRRILKGDEVVPNLGDLDAVHIDEHYKQTTTDEYRRAIKGDAKLHDAMRVHINIHMIQMAEKQLRLKSAETEAAAIIAKEQAAGESQGERIGKLIVELSVEDLLATRATIEDQIELAQQAAQQPTPNAPLEQAGLPQPGPPDIQQPVVPAETVGV